METTELTSEQLKLRENNLYICPCCKNIKSVKDTYFYQKTSFVHTHDTRTFGRITRHYDTSTYLVRLCEPCFREQVRKSKIELYLLIFFVALFAILGAVVVYILSLSQENPNLLLTIFEILILGGSCGWIVYYIIGWLCKLIHYFSDKKFKYERNIGNNAIENIRGVDKSRVYEPKIASVKEI